MKGYFLREPLDLTGDNFLLVVDDYGNFLNLNADWRRYKPWICSLPVSREIAERLDPVFNKRRSALDYPFKRIFLCPNSERNFRYLKGKIEKVIDITNSESFLLDYFRFPNRLRNFFSFVDDNEFCFCKYCQKKFEEVFGKSIFEASEREFIEFRALSIYDLAKRIREEFEGFEVYVCLRADLDMAFLGNGQDWRLLRKVFDRLFVMAYFKDEGYDMDWFRKVLDEKDKILGEKGEIIVKDYEVKDAMSITKDFYVLIGYR